MSKQRHSAEQIIAKLCAAEVLLARGQAVGQACKVIGVSVQTFNRWRAEYGGLKVDQARRLKDLGREKARLRKAVADLTLDKLILQGTTGPWRADA